MNTIKTLIDEYIEYCLYRKRLDKKTLKAYKIDLRQFYQFNSDLSEALHRDNVDSYITYLIKSYKPKTAKRKIASLKAFFSYLIYKELLTINPFDKLDIHFREPKLLPKTIPFHAVQTFLSTLINKKKYLIQNINVNAVYCDRK